MSLKLSPAAKRAALIGSTCSISYLAVYIARNILGAVSPQMIEGGVFSTESIGSLSSIYFVCYALGQLINGYIGDKIKARYMISCGLALAGVCNFGFAISANSVMQAYIAYACTGFFLSMIFGPMTKLVAENVEPIYAPRCSLGYTFSSFFGSPAAGLLAAFLSWQKVFAFNSIMLLFMGCVVFVSFLGFERKGIIQYYKYQKQEKKAGGVRLLLKHRIIKFTLIAIITGIVRTTVVFWMPTYFNQYLGFSPEVSARIFTVATFIISFAAFIAIFVYERLKRNMDLTILLFFIISAVCFLLVYWAQFPGMNTIFLIAAITASNCSACMLWSRYCPGLRDTGMVSAATGFLDATSYLAAAASSKSFSNAVSGIGWGNLILVWAGLMVVGILVALPYRKMSCLKK